MRLTPREVDKLQLFVAAEVARRRRDRGLKLNHPEAVAFIAAALLEGVRDGRSVADLMAYGTTLLGPDDVMEGVAETIHDVQVEGTFPDGTMLITVHDPIRGDRSDGTRFVPGEIDVADGDLDLNAGRRTATVDVVNEGDRPVQVGSHTHVYEVNEALTFDRSAAYGMRLDVPAGTDVRFEPGERRTVHLVAFRGRRHAYGMRGLVNGPLDGSQPASQGASEERR